MNSHRVALVGGLVWTAGYSAPRKLDVMIEKGRIAAVAERGDLDLSGASTHDLADQLLVSGFQDAHLHAASGGLDLLTCDLSQLQSEEEILDAVREYADRHTELPWIIAGGWNREIFTRPDEPTRQALDSAVPDRPAVLIPYDRHGLWANSMALAAAGVDSGTPDPPKGIIYRDADGAPSGVVEEGAVALIRAAMPPVTTKDLKGAIVAAQEYLLPLGVTAVQDALVGTGLGMHDQHEAFCELLGGTELRLRVTTALWWDPARGPEQIDELLRRRHALEASGSEEWIVADTVKVMVDGTGLVFMDEEQVREATVLLDAHGFTVHYHSYGDATTRWVLDAVEEAIRRNGKRPRRHHIAHLFVVTEEDFARFRALGVTATVQGFWAGSEVPHERLGHSTMTEDPHTREYAYGRLLAAGAHLAAGSDWPVTTANPLEAMRVAAGVHPDHGVTHSIPERDRVDLHAMMTAYTAGSAWVNGRGLTTGRIAVGYAADFAVIDRNVFASEQDLLGARITETWIDGMQVFTLTASSTAPAYVHTPSARKPPRRT